MVLPLLRWLAQNGLLARKQRGAGSVKVPLALQVPDEAPERTGAIQAIFSPVKELFLAGNLPIGQALPGALQEAARFGLESAQLGRLSCASLGTLVGLLVALEMPFERMPFFLQKVSQEALWHDLKKIIWERTSLWDPTFSEWYHAGCKTLRVIGASGKELFSYQKSPQEKVIAAVRRACHTPFEVPRKWVSSYESLGFVFGQARSRSFFSQCFQRTLQVSTIFPGSLQEGSFQEIGQQSVRSFVASQWGTLQELPLTKAFLYRSSWAREIAHLSCSDRSVCYNASLRLKRKVFV